MSTRFVLSLAVVLAFGAMLTVASAAPGDDVAQVVHGSRFIDADGDGFNDNAPDSDADGIPNGQDADYVRPQDGSGRQLQRGDGLPGMKFGKNAPTDARGFRPGPGYGLGDGDGDDHQHLREGIGAGANGNGEHTAGAGLHR